MGMMGEMGKMTSFKHFYLFSGKIRLNLCRNNGHLLLLSTKSFHGNRSKIVSQIRIKIAVDSAVSKDFGITIQITLAHTYDTISIA